jgi:hypothetical protein
MTITVKDGSEYFRGLLLLIAKDHRITEEETTLMKRIGKTLGFENDFCDNAFSSGRVQLHQAIELSSATSHHTLASHLRLSAESAIDS